jgi:hypothetical protein
MLLTNQNIFGIPTGQIVWTYEAKTYIALDSIAIKRRIASRLRFGRKIINGYLPLVFLIWTYAKSSAIITTKGSEWVLGVLQMTGFKKFQN